MFHRGRATTMVHLGGCPSTRESRYASTHRVRSHGRKRESRDLRLTQKHTTVENYFQLYIVP